MDSIITEISMVSQSPVKMEIQVESISRCSESEAARPSASSRATPSLANDILVVIKVHLHDAIGAKAVANHFAAVRHQIECQFPVMDKR